MIGLPVLSRKIQVVRRRSVNGRREGYAIVPSRSEHHEGDAVLMGEGMTELPFRLDLLQFLADHRTGFLTQFFLLTTFIGDVGGYVLIIIGLYVLWDKRLAV